MYLAVALYLVNAVGTEVENDDHSVCQRHIGAVRTRGGDIACITAIGNVPAAAAIFVIDNAVDSLGIGIRIAVGSILGIDTVNITARVTFQGVCIPTGDYLIGVRNVSAVQPKSNQKGIQHIGRFEARRCRGRLCVGALRVRQAVGNITDADGVVRNIEVCVDVGGSRDASPIGGPIPPSVNIP